MSWLGAVSCAWNRLEFTDDFTPNRQRDLDRGQRYHRGVAPVIQPDAQPQQPRRQDIGGRAGLRHHRLPDRRLYLPGPGQQRA